MGDFDFDELDKAVTGAISSRDENGMETATPKQNEEVKKSAPAARRSSGRFMDVVHPSSDMRSKQKAKSSFSTPRSVQNDTKPVSENHNTSHHEDADKSSERSEGDDSLTQPLESPFLTDAKVEKRPLGGYSPVSTATEKQEDEKSSSSEETELIVEEQSTEDAVTEHLNEEPEDPLLEAPDDPLLEATTQPDPIDFETDRTTSSIPQQYTEKESSAPESGAIYDTEAYHQPVLAPTQKKSSSVLVFIWILLLVILGAGAGVAFYLFVLPLF